MSAHVSRLRAFTCRILGDMLRLTRSKAAISLSVNSAVSALAPAASPARRTAKTADEPVFAVAVKSPTNTASDLGGIREIFIAAKPLFITFRKSLSGVPAAAMLSASAITASTLS